jgi:membrane fusion protein (multidrug efflux system)
MSHEASADPPPPVNVPAKKPPSPAIGFGIMAGVVFVLAVGALLVWRAEAKVSKVALADSAKPATTIEAKATTFRASRLYVGTLRPWVEAKIGPQFISAYVQTVLVRPGAVVKQNEVLATLDCRYAGAANQAVAMEAKAIDAQQKAVADEASRLKTLLDGGFVSANESEMKTAMSEAQQAQLLSQKAKMLNSSLQVSDCVLRAPFDGEVATRDLDPGAFARPESQIVSIVDRTIVRVIGDAPEIDFGIVAPGTPVRIHALATGKELTAMISRRAPSADPGTRTVHFEVDVPDPKHELPVDTTAEIGIDVGEPIPATEIPLYAASIRGDKAVLFVVKGDVAHSLTVNVQGEVGGDLYLATNLKPGTKVVTEGRMLLEDGDRVSTKAAEVAAMGLPDVKKP